MPKKNEQPVGSYLPKHKASNKISSDFSTASNESVKNVGSSNTASMQDVFSSAARRAQHEEQAAQLIQPAEELLPATDSKPMESISSVSAEAVKKSKKKLIAKIALLFFSVAALVVGGAFIYAETQLSRINYVQDNSDVSVAVASYITSAEVNSNTDVNLGNIYMKNGLYHDDAIKNILIMGVDDYQKNDVGRSDSMMLISVDTRHNKLKVTSFLRDLYLSIPDCSEPNRINVAYSIGKAPLTVQTIEGNFGIDIDNYVTVGYSSFAKIIDRLSGVTVTVTEDEAKRVNLYSGESKSKYLTAGTFLLTGKQALYYSRIRTPITGDFERTERQRKVFNSIINKFKNSNLGTINGILSDVLPLVTTNMDKNKVVDLVKNSLTYMKYPTSQNRIPADNTWEDGSVTIGGVPGNSVIVADMQKNSLIAAKFIYEDDFNFPSDSTDSGASSSTGE